MPILRKNPITDQWVIIAPERSQRPREVVAEHRAIGTSECPFCAGHEADTPPPIRTYRVPSPSDTDDVTTDATCSENMRPESTWDVRVVPNKYPALRLDAALAAGPPSSGPSAGEGNGTRGDGLYEMMEGVGTHEVVVEAAEHVVSLAERTTEQIATVLQAWRDRLVELGQNRRLACAMVFKNHGALAGATLEHVHSQIMGLPVVPLRLREELDGAKRYFTARERCVWCDILERELQTGERLVYANDDAVALAPYASRFPFETWILPRRHEPCYEASDPHLLAGVADVLRTVLRKLDVALTPPAYNLVLHTAPFEAGDHPHFHWHIEIIPRSTTIAGFEWGSGFYINPTPSETAARYLREIDSK